MTQKTIKVNGWRLWLLVIFPWAIGWYAIARWVFG